MAETPYYVAGTVEQDHAEAEGGWVPADDEEREAVKQAQNKVCAHDCVSRSDSLTVSVCVQKNSEAWSRCRVVGVDLTDPPHPPHAHGRCRCTCGEVHVWTEREGDKGRVPI